MAMVHGAARLVLRLIVTYILIYSPASTSATSDSLVGINYGLVADNLPSPDKVAPLLTTIGVGRVKIYNAEPKVLHAFANTGVELIIGLPNECVAKTTDPSAALAWVRANIQPYLPATKIAAVTVGNEVLTSNDTTLAKALLPSMLAVAAALQSLSLSPQITVTTTHSVAVLSTSYPPSAGAFRRDLLPYLCPILDFHLKSNTPLLINAYPYFAYKADPKGVPLNYALFQPNSGVADAKTGLRYTNMLHAQVDAVYAAVAAAGGDGANKIEVRVSETGWPSAGDEDEPGATAENAAKYNGNLMKMVADGKGTPARPKVALRVYVFALFNENLKPGPASERNYGLFKPDGTPAYQLGIVVPKENSTSTHAGGGGGIDGDDSPGQADGYYSYSSAWRTTERGAVAVVAAMWLLSWRDWRLRGGV